MVLDHCRPLDPVMLPLERSAGRVLATEVVAPEDVPPFDNTAVDGYAVRAADVAEAPVELVVAGEIKAGDPPGEELRAGEAIRIMTGAPIPPGADAVVMVERSEILDDGRVRLSAPAAPGDAVRAAGSDVTAGTTVLAAGTEITPAVVGLLATVNARTVEVRRAAKVAVLSTGDELVTDGSALEPGQIRESNLSMLVAALGAAGCEVMDLGVVPDDEAQLERVLRTAAGECDAIVSSGGVSMGDYDVVKAVLGRIADMRWMQVAIKPAKPFAFGVLDGVPVFGLPGNPVSSLVSFELLARPALRHMMGFDQLHRFRVTAIADEAFPRKTDGKVHFARVIGAFAGDGRYHIRSVGAQGSHQLAATALADALAVLPDGDGVAEGGDVDALLLAHR